MMIGLFDYLVVEVMKKGLTCSNLSQNIIPLQNMKCSGKLSKNNFEEKKMKICWFAKISMVI
jgi:hypothetical protein